MWEFTPGDGGKLEALLRRERGLVQVLSMVGDGLEDLVLVRVGSSFGQCKLGLLAAVATEDHQGFLRKQRVEEQYADDSRRRVRPSATLKR